MEQATAGELLAANNKSKVVMTLGPKGCVYVDNYGTGSNEITPCTGRS